VKKQRPDKGLPPIPECTLPQVRQHGVPVVASWEHLGRRVLVVGSAGPYGRLAANGGRARPPGADPRGS
jgi:hypothetical protein